MMMIPIIVTRTWSGRLLFNDSDFVMIMTIIIIEKNMMRKDVQWWSFYDNNDYDVVREITIMMTMIIFEKNMTRQCIWSYNDYFMMMFKINDIMMMK
jgi:hypothetical protein